MLDIAIRTWAILTPIGKVAIPDASASQPTLHPVSSVSSTAREARSVMIK
jgi:hypothetical protein